MEDIAFIAGALVFFAICVAYIRGLDRIVRKAQDSEAPAEEPTR